MSSERGRWCKLSVRYRTGTSCSFEHEADEAACVSVRQSKVAPRDNVTSFSIIWMLEGVFYIIVWRF